MTFNSMSSTKHNSDVYRVVNIEWHQVTNSAERRSGMKSQNQVVAQCIARNGQDLQGDDREIVYVGYVINDLLHDMIRRCLEPYNDDYDLLLENIDV